MVILLAHGSAAPARVQSTAAPAATSYPCTFREPPSKVIMTLLPRTSRSTSSASPNGTATSS
eukprot:4395212-Lingulodinium_polyedra.AAC.1